MQKEILGKFTEQVVKRTQKIKIGDPLLEDTRMGPLINRPHLERVLGFVKLAKEQVRNWGAGGPFLGLQALGSRGLGRCPHLSLWWVATRPSGSARGGGPVYSTRSEHCGFFVAGGQGAVRGRAVRTRRPQTEGRLLHEPLRAEYVFPRPVCSETVRTVGWERVPVKCVHGAEQGLADGVSPAPRVNK